MKLTDSGRFRVLYVITGLGTGGAEMMLYKLLEATASLAHSKVVVLMGRGTLSEKFDSLGVDVEYLGMRQGKIPNPYIVLRMMFLSRRFSPDTIHGWMYHGNLAAWLVGRWASREAQLIWNIRQTLYDLNYESGMTRSLIRLSRWLSSAPLKIIYNSELSARQHEAIGYPRQSGVVIPNGFDLNRFKPEKTARESVDYEFDLPPSAPLVVHAARYHPMKDHRTLLIAAKQVAEDLPDARFLLVGRGVTKENEDLKSLCQNLGLMYAVILGGERFDLSRLMSAADVVVLSSAWGEGFPNVLGEAMACGTPCVVTNVGDSAYVLGECGIVVPPRDPNALAIAIANLLSDSHLRNDLGSKARRRIQELYSIDRISKSYLDLYRGNLA
jgi:glycosyltransferase involved in cell wall biosynthesis